MPKTNAQAQEIGNTIRQLRLEGGYDSRSSFIGTKSLKGKLTQEGLRKIESGERVPKMETLHRLTHALGASPEVVKKLEHLALEKSIERATRRAGNVSVQFAIDGQMLDVSALPTKKQTEDFVRKTVDDLIEVTKRLGMDGPDDEKYFRQRARAVLLRNLT